MDLVGTAAVVGAANVLKQPVQDFLTRVSGPAADELGDWIREKVQGFRNRNTQRTTQRAAEMLAIAGREPRAIPLRSLIPLIEGSSLEDDGDLAELWAALLANAAIDSSGGVRPIFSATLRQITPFDARLLTVLQARELAGLPKHPRPPGGAIEFDRWGVNVEELCASLECETGPQLDASLSTLRALGLTEAEPPVRTYQGSALVYTDNGEVRLSPLGNQFLDACTAPSRQAV